MKTERKTARKPGEGMQKDGMRNRPTFERCPSQLWYMNYENCRRFN